MTCVECGIADSVGAGRGWRGYLTVEEPSEPAEVAIYCPDCAELEFGGFGQSG